MKCNVGRTEKLIRIGIGIIIGLMGIYYKNWWGLIGLIPIITGAIGYCPVSDFLGVSSCKAENK